jgi:Tol biopolymer transport system component
VSAVVHPADDRVFGWTPDGKHLLFMSDRNGLPGLWWLPFENGKPQGAPHILRPNFGSNLQRYLGQGRSGEIYYQVAGGGVRVSAGSLDIASGKISGQTVQQFIHNIYPAWSPDGKELVSNTYQMPRGEIFLTVRSPETGRTRELRPELKYPRWPAWSPDGRSLLVEGGDSKGRWGIFKVDAQSAEAVPVVTSVEGEALTTPQWFPDGKRILYERTRKDQSVIVERELASGQESEIVRIKVLPRQAQATRSFLLSPDGRSLAYLTSNGSPAHTAILLKPLAGGDPREFLKLIEFAFLRGWTPY